MTNDALHSTGPSCNSRSIDGDQCLLVSGHMGQHVSGSGTWEGTWVHHDSGEAAIDIIARATAPRQADMVDHPPHYASMPVEPIDAIEAWELTFNLGNVVKYIARAGRKDPAKYLEDLRKAAWYLNREINR